MGVFDAMATSTATRALLNTESSLTLPLTQVKDGALPMVHALRTIRALRSLLQSRGGWKQLEQDMEKGPQAGIATHLTHCLCLCLCHFGSFCEAYLDVVQALQTKKTPQLDLAKWLDVKGPYEAGSLRLIKLNTLPEFGRKIGRQIPLTIAKPTLRERERERARNADDRIFLAITE